MPARESTAEFDPSLTFQPSQRRRLGRASIEALRIVFPLTFVTAYGYLVVHELMPIAEEERWLEMALGHAPCAKQGAVQVRGFCQGRSELGWGCAAV